MRDGALLDRLYQAMREDGRPWSSAEIAQRILRLSATGAGTDKLVAALVAGDPRFSREGANGSWEARERIAPAMSQQLRVLVWPSLTPPNEPSAWTVAFLDYDPNTPAASRARGELRIDDAGGWSALREGYEDALFLTGQPAALHRFARHLEQRHALAEWEPRTVDLTAWAALALVDEGVSPTEARRSARLKSLAARWGLRQLESEDTDASRLALELLRQVADRLFEQYPDWSIGQLEQSAEERLGSRPVPWDLYAFGPKDLDALPRQPGIYRFFGENDRLLYVGKSVDLARRVASHFAPLPPEPTKRDEFVREIRRLDVRALGSELEALVREARAIREESPKWNVQLEVHTAGPELAGHQWPLLFQSSRPSTREPASNSSPAQRLFALSGPDRGWMLDPEADALGAWIEQLLHGRDLQPEPAAEAGGEPLHPEEVRLALRYFHRQRDELHTFESARFASAAELHEAVGRPRQSL